MYYFRITNRKPTDWILCTTAKHLASAEKMASGYCRKVFPFSSVNLEILDGLVMDGEVTGQINQYTFHGNKKSHSLERLLSSQFRSVNVNPNQTRAMPYDFAKLKEQLDIVTEIGMYVKLKRNGRNMVGCCPFHNENTPSFNVYPDQHYKCFGCGKHGDVISFLREYCNMTLDEIEAHATGSAITIKPTYQKPQKAEPEYQTIAPLETLEPYKIYHVKLKKPSKVYIYHDENGKPYSCVCRFDTPDGKKQVLPYSYCWSPQSHGWKWKGLDAPRLLYNAHQIKAYRNRQVLIVEGEKTADAAAKLFTDVIVTTWIGGSNGVDKANWELLRGRSVVLSPDNDEPGYKCMNQIGHLLSKMGCKIKWLQPAGDEKGWDWADWNGSAIKAQCIFKEARVVRFN